MKDYRALIEYLFNDGEEESDFRHDLISVAEQVKTEAGIEVKKGPLVKILSDMGVVIPEDSATPDFGSVVVTFDSAADYQAAADILELPDGMEALARGGWVMNLCGDRGQDDYRIRFIELDLDPVDMSNSETAPSLEKIAKDSAKDGMAKAENNAPASKKDESTDQQRQSSAVDQLIESTSPKKTFKRR